MKHCNNCILPNTRPNITMLSNEKYTAFHSHNNKKKSF